MSNETRTVNSSSASGIGFTGLLGIVFIVLKLTGYIDWDWVWVLAPIWIPWALLFTFIIVAALGVGGVTLFDHRRSKRRRKA